MTESEEVELEGLQVEFKDLVLTPSGKRILRLLELMGQQSLEWSASQVGEDVFRYQGRWHFVRELLDLRNE